jgi:hypothetical protein
MSLPLVVLPFTIASSATPQSLGPPTLLFFSILVRANDDNADSIWVQLKHALTGEWTDDKELPPGASWSQWVNITNPRSEHMMYSADQIRLRAEQDGDGGKAELTT